MENINTLYRERAEHVAPYLQLDLKHATQRMEWLFALFSTNLHNLLPDLPRKEYVPTFRRLQANLALTFMDIEHAACPGFMQARGWDDAWATTLRERPGIVCTYHTGAYRYLNHLLVAAGVQLSIVVAGRAIPAEQRLLDRASADIDLIDAEQPHALFSMAKAAKQGRSLLVYIDGNTGTNGNAADADRHNLLTVPFCGWQVKVRQGVAALAYRLQLPLYPVICEREVRWGMRLNHLLTYWHFNPICPLPDESQAAFAARATARLYGLLEQFVVRNPDQWEGWLGLQHDLVLPAPAELDEEEHPMRWAPYRRGNQAFLLHRPTYASYRITWKEFYRLYPWYNMDFLDV